MVNLRLNLPVNPPTVLHNVRLALTYQPLQNLAGLLGFEPRLTLSKSVVLTSYTIVLKIKNLANARFCVSLTLLSLAG